MAGQGNDLMLGWAIGLFEGEGCIAHDKNRDRYFLVLASTDEDVVIRFRDALGCGNIRGPFQRGKNKPYWIWRAGARADVIAVLESFLPNLGERRGMCALTALEALKSRPLGRHRSATCRNGHDRVEGTRRCMECHRTYRARAKAVSA